MAEVMIRLLAETVIEPLQYLKAKLYGENGLSQTILGKDYGWSCLRRSRGAQRWEGQSDILKGHGDTDTLWREVVSFSYGPFYRTWNSSVSTRAKEEAWQHVLRRSGTDETETTRLYVEAVTNLENECRALYGVDDPSIANVPSDEFVWMMIRDGCFLLQVALLVLGGSQHLNYPADDPIFGEPSVDQALNVRIALGSMFMVGNQIPLVVLKELMNQSFFKNVVDKGRWEQPLDLERLVLFKLLLVPMLYTGERGAVSIPTGSLRAYPLFCKYVGKPWSKVWRSGMGIRYWFKKDDPSKKVIDLLHGLWLLVNGVAEYSDVDDGVNNQEEDGDPRHTSYYVIFPAVRSATELAEAGVVIKHNAGTRINGIRMQKSYV